jgi:hypothetical protein
MKPAAASSKAWFALWFTPSPMRKSEQAQALAQMFGKAWGYPMLLVASTERRASERWSFLRAIEMREKR